MKVLITGAKGMLGRTLMRRLSEHECVGVDVEDFDIADASATDETIASVKPDAVIHCAAMTAVDACETETDKAWRINSVGSSNIAVACGRHSARLIAISTDYVFPGDLDRPYHEFDVTGPRSVYGASKLAGEESIRLHCPDHVIARIAWLYGPGGPSFVHTMLKLGAQDGDAMKVVNDQVGNPTSTDAVAGHLLTLLETPLAGTVHLTCEGQATWYELAREIFRMAGFKREVVPCTSEEYPRPAPRPSNSRLEKRMLRLHNLPQMPHWKDALTEFWGLEGL